MSKKKSYVIKQKWQENLPNSVINLAQVWECEATVTARIRVELAKFRECGELLCGKCFLSKLELWSTILYGHVLWMENNHVL